MERRPIIPTPAGSLLLQALFRLAVLLFVSPVATSFTNDFSGYPAGAQACLYDAADQSGCQGDTSQAMNACLCAGGGDGGSDFVTTAGACIGADDAGDLRSTWVCSHHRKISLGVYIAMLTACLLVLCNNPHRKSCLHIAKTRARPSACPKTTSSLWHRVIPPPPRQRQQQRQHPRHRLLLRARSRRQHRPPPRHPAAATPTLVKNNNKEGWAFTPAREPAS